MIVRGLLAAAAIGALAALAACDESQVWHRPDFQTDRMQVQSRVDPFDRGTAPPPPFTVARGRGPASHPRPAVTRDLVEQGRRAFEVTCAACHGIRGDGESVVATKMLLRRPPSLMEPRIRGLSDEQIHTVVERGYGMMPPYDGQLAHDERWAVVAYVRALEIAQGVPVASLSPAMRAELAREAP